MKHKGYRDHGHGFHGRDHRHSHEHASEYGHGMAHGIPLKKQYGQHFLRDQSVIDAMLAKVHLDENTNVFEIGCGDGFLTRSILKTPIKQLWVFEIDPDWAAYVAKTYPDSRMTIFQDNILDIDFARFEPGPWTLLANLPYQITFPILTKLKDNRHLLAEGVVMVQEEVAQKITAQPGDSTVQSLFFGYYFEWHKLVKILPGAFYPPPAINSRLLHFKPKTYLQPIEHEEEFWKCVKLCFMHRRRTLKNNLMSTHYNLTALPERFAKARAQELSFTDFIELWNAIRV